MQRDWISLPDPDLANLVEGTKEFSAYISELRRAQHFALLNRAEMMDRAVEAMTEYLGQAVERQETIQCPPQLHHPRGPS